MVMYLAQQVKCLILVCIIVNINGLYPRESPTREVKKLDGIWNFRICSQNDQDIGFREHWENKSLAETGEVIPMPVPSSFNDITQNKTIRDYLGWSWYETTFYVSPSWKEKLVFLRFGSAHYFTIVYLNGKYVMNHTGGHLPFEQRINGLLDFQKINRLTVALNNTLSQTTVPQGSKIFKSPKEGPYPPGYYAQSTNFDFFNYAGIHRSVVVYAVPPTYLKDIALHYKLNRTQNYSVADIDFALDVVSNGTVSCFMKVLDKSGKTEVAICKHCNDTFTLANPKLWWPYGMSENAGYQYTLQISIIVNRTEVDVYFLKIGLRNIEITNGTYFVNGKRFYFMGFGKHEDADIRGKGLDLPLIVKDFNLIKWIGANSFRTSHYPYSEELMDLADEEGIVVIDEGPAVGLQSFTKPIFEKHLQALKELIHRDRYRPSVFAWSVANEPRSSLKEADSYFKKLLKGLKGLDPMKRPFTAAINADPQTEHLGKYLDFVMMNRYHSWYSDTGSTEVIVPLLVNDVQKAFQIYQKPIMISEYGGDTVAGLHMDPPFIFTEDYQVELMIQHHKAFDILRKNASFIGEHIWNFADFLTLQEIQRVVGNKKGIFTRERQPKASAKILRCRYHYLTNRTLTSDIGYCPSLASSSNKSCLYSHI